MPLYLIRAGQNVVRICYRASDAKLNLEAMQAANPEKLTVVGQRDHWGKNAAVALHERFGHLHIRGEWYKWTTELLDVLKEGIQRRVGKEPTRERKTDRNEEIITRLITENVTMSDVAKEFGITRERVRQIARDHYGQTARSLGIIERKGTNKRAKKQAKDQAREERKRRKDALIQRVTSLRDKGLSQVKIANRLGIYQSQVSLMLIEAGRRTRAER